MTLTDFLLARFSEDEEIARGAYRDSVDNDGVCHERWTDATTAVMWGDLAAITGLEADYLANHIARHDPTRVLAECEAKRRIVERITHTLTEGVYPDLNRRERSQGHRTLCDLALPYADHPDYREEWKS